MRYEISNEAITLFLVNPKREAEATRSTNLKGVSVSEGQLTPMLDALVMKYGGLSLSAQGNLHSDFIKPLFEFLRSSSVQWPTRSVEWQVFVAGLFQYYLTDDKWSQAKTNTRINLWRKHVAAILNFLKEQEVLPLDIVIPTLIQKKVQSLAASQPLLGQADPRTVSDHEPIRKLLVDIDFGKTDADYLDSIERRCRSLVEVLMAACRAHWTSLMKDMATGVQLGALITDADIDRVIKSGLYSEVVKGGTSEKGRSLKRTSVSHPMGINWALSIVRRALAEAESIDCISLTSLRASPFFSEHALVSPRGVFRAFRSYTEMPLSAFDQLTPHAQLYRFAGLLSDIDVAAARCILTMEHPHITSESMQDAVLLNVRGKSRLLITDNSGHSIFYCDKPRAGALKYATLTDLSQQVILDIIRVTAPVRDVLKRAGIKTWRYLFLGVGKRAQAHGTLGVVEGRPRHIHGGSSRLGLTDLYPALVEHGLDKGNADYRRLRNTMGIIRWLETGSIQELRRRLGNTYRVAVEHYLPPALLHAWNTRIIRRFQNTLIVLAAYDEPYLLEVTDFASVADLQHFVGQLISDYPKDTSPLANQVHARLNISSAADTGSKVTPSGFLNFRLAPRSLGLLYSFSDLALRTMTQADLDKVDSLSGLSPRQFTDMAALLRHAAENATIHDALRENLDIPLLRLVHGEALALKTLFDAKFARFAVANQWGSNHG